MASIKRKRAAPAPVLPEVLQNFVDTRLLTPELAEFLVVQQMTTRDLLAQLPESLPELLASFADAEAVRPAGARCALLLVIKQCRQSLVPAPPLPPTIPAVTSVVAPPPAPLSLASLEAAATSLAQPAPAKVAGKFTYPDLLRLGD
ncbi:MAG: hypothetical protein GY835_08805, partial [bacterium]|nr:hypothetical protein [bacterium]